LSRYPVQLPYIAIANRQAEIMPRIAAEFGLRPQAAAVSQRPPPLSRPCSI
jgi:hypothetical protein